MYSAYFVVRYTYDHCWTHMTIQ